MISADIINSLRAEFKKTPEMKCHNYSSGSFLSHILRKKLKCIYEPQKQTESNLASGPARHIATLFFSQCFLYLPKVSGMKK